MNIEDLLMQQTREFVSKMACAVSDSNYAKFDVYRDLYACSTERLLARNFVIPPSMVKLVSTMEKQIGYTEPGGRG